MKRFRFRHNPTPEARRDWLELQNILDEIQGEPITFSLSGIGATHDERVVHSLGVVPSSVEIVSVIPADGLTAFSVWDAGAHLRTKRHVILRSNSANVGDKVVVKVKP